MFEANDWIAYTLATTYGFSPPRKVGPARLRQTNAGKYESVGVVFGERCFLLAHWFDKTNILIKFDPFALEPDGS